MQNWLKTSLKIIAGIVVFILLVLLGTMLYITYNKAKILKLVNTELNKKLDGMVTIGDLQPQFFNHFPNISLALKNVLVRDRRYDQHHHTLLNAKDFYVSVNAAGLLNGTISINQIDIGNASFDLYTDSTGYSNTSVFKKNPKKKKGSSSKGNSSAELEKFSLTNVDFKVDDRKAKKLFNFIVNSLNGQMSNPDSGWQANFHLDVTAKSMAFDTNNGSFIKGKGLEGDFSAGYNEANGEINVTADALNIGGNPFKINAVVETNEKPAIFLIHISSDNILWRNAAALLALNIKNKLDQFNIDQPIAVSAAIEGSFGSGDPLLFITARVKNSKVTTPGAIIDNCSFKGIFTNNYQKGKGLTDENSVIRLIKMTGSYSHLPFAIDTGSIINLKNPIATGNFRADFPVSDLNYLLGAQVAKFSNGKADMQLRYKADIVNYRLNKPVVAGAINITNAGISYLPKNLHLTNSSISLNFIGNDLVLKNIRLQSGRSVIKMEGRVNNFLNLYYNAPEKILLTWQIHSPQLYLGEFFGFLSGGTGKQDIPRKAAANSGNAIDQISIALEKGNAEMHLDAANVHYFKFLATDVHADLLTSADGVTIRNAGLKNAGGFLKFSGSLKKGDAFNKLSLKTTISKVNIKKFFYSFNNFGLTDFTADNLQGILSAKTSITAGITDKGLLVSHSLNGTLDINLKNGALINFKPIYSVAKFAFPFRSLKDIKIAELNARFDVHGDQVTIHPLKFSSNVLNMDIAGVYGLNKGTDIALDIPLRNPKNDTSIHNQQELLKKRYKGIVLHVLAKADSAGKIKIGWNKNHKDTNKYK